ncbi:UDP-3-O-acyl-N-acetylglucosamine deacetylase [Rhodopila globiformis]|uniref:UDP-3-O-acyl-N-acetylglucosamine deacetylase n=1 Tax=Rhodopila globiformis TaxID=1071 RepID=A0A2S6MYM9_RHOGL|nr:UDP-3-O-acyl-N-acetylglucosamine deacetylase [Rhodopila globiformis]PPQ27461.1 UDP-3-O-[3-hydroxymyristoyl] N-acetylglucosamine deacetylase [Rhodopila globiformis]
MDGFVRLNFEQTTAPRWEQRTLKAAIGCVGVGVHTGRRVNLTFRPAEADHGIVFRRTDLGRDIEARFDNVCDTRLCTSVADPGMPSARIGTIEHVMAALAGAGIDNAVVEIDGPEVPILDGSAAPFLFLLDCAGVRELDASRRVIEVRKTIRVTAGDAWAELRPLGPAFRSAQPVLEMDLSIDFAASAIGRQSCSLRLTPESFRHELASARTFAQAEEVEQLRAAGLARGGSLDNAIVVDGGRVLNIGGLRMESEFANHKMLDAVGDLALAGGPLHGRFVAHRTGHDLNNRLLKALFADIGAWRSITTEPLVSVAA